MHPIVNHKRSPYRFSLINQDGKHRYANDAGCWGTSCYYLGALHLQASFLAQNSTSLFAVPQEIKIHISLSFITSITFTHCQQHKPCSLSRCAELQHGGSGGLELQDLHGWGLREGWGQEVLLGTDQDSSKGCRAGNICRLAVTSALSLKHRNMFLASCGHINSGKLIRLLLKGKPFWILKQQWPLWWGALRYF